MPRSSTPSSRKFDRHAKEEEEEEEPERQQKPEAAAGLSVADAYAEAEASTTTPSTTPALDALNFEGDIVAGVLDFLTDSGAADDRVLKLGICGVS